MRFKNLFGHRGDRIPPKPMIEQPPSPELAQTQERPEVRAAGEEFRNLLVAAALLELKQSAGGEHKFQVAALTRTDRPPKIIPDFKLNGQTLEEHFRLESQRPKDVGEGTFEFSDNPHNQYQHFNSHRIWSEFAQSQDPNTARELRTRFIQLQLENVGVSLSYFEELPGHIKKIHALRELKTELEAELAASQAK